MMSAWSVCSLHALLLKILDATLLWILDATSQHARKFCWCVKYWSVSPMQALEMGLVNAVVPLEELEQETLRWCRQILRNSPTALRVLKAALNAAVRTLHASAKHPYPHNFWQLHAPLLVCFGD